MGKVAGANASGDSLTYETVTPSNSFIGMGTSVFSVGDPGKNPDVEYVSVEKFDEDNMVYEKLYFKDDKFSGGILIGDVSKSPQLLEAYKNQESFSNLVSKRGAMNRLKVNLYEFLSCLSNAQDMVMPRLSNHHHMVAYLAYKLAERANLSVNEQKNVISAALIHDIGALSIG